MKITNSLVNILVVVIILKVTVTAYHAPCKKCGTKSRTYTGTNASLPGVAVDPKVIPLGSKVKINGIWYLADDVGPKGKRVDIRLSNGKNAHEKAKAYGKKHLTITVKKKKKKM